MFLSDEWIDINKIRELWQKYGIGTMVNIQLVKRKFIINGKDVELESVVKYIFKYIYKTFNDKDNNRYNTTLCLKWALMARAFSISKAVSLIIRGNKTNSNQEWVYVCSIPASLLAQSSDLTYDSVRSIIMQFMGGG